MTRRKRSEPKRGSRPDPALTVVQTKGVSAMQDGRDYPTSAEKGNGWQSIGELAKRLVEKAAK